MTTKSILQLTAAAILAIFTVSVTVAWRAELRARAQLQHQLKTAQTQITEATTRQSTRNAALQQQIAQLQKKQSAIQKPADILKALPEVLPLPKPLILDQAPVAQPLTGVPATGTVKPNTPTPQLTMPIEDLKPLYDSAIQCKECQLQLATAQANLKDEQVKTASMSRELTDALRASKGGSVLRRVARAAKWFAIGAAIGAAAAKAAH